MPPRRWYQQPLLHFFAIGAALLGAQAVARRARPARDATVISLAPSFVQGLRARERGRLGREPTPAELAAAREAWVTEEALYREALALGLDRGDPIIRQRLVQKMEFLAEDSAEAREPTDDEVSRYIAARPGRYDGAPRVTVEHVFVRGERADAEAVAAGLLARLAAGEAPGPLGDPFAAGRSFSNESPEALSRALGEPFSRAAAEAPAGRWYGPVRSPFGWHALRVRARAAGEPSRERARGELVAERRREARERAFAEVRARYTVR